MADDQKPTADDAKSDAKSAVRKLADGSPQRDFAHYDDAAAQAKALGSKAHVVSIGTAHHVAIGDDE